MNADGSYRELYVSIWVKNSWMGYPPPQKKTQPNKQTNKQTSIHILVYNINVFLASFLLQYTCIGEKRLLAHKI